MHMCLCWFMIQTQGVFRAYIYLNTSGIIHQLKLIHRPHYDEHRSGSNRAIIFDGLDRLLVLLPSPARQFGANGIFPKDKSECLRSWEALWYLKSIALRECVYAISDRALTRIISVASRRYMRSKLYVLIMNRVIASLSAIYTHDIMRNSRSLPVRERFARMVSLRVVIGLTAYPWFMEFGTCTP